LSEKGVCPVAQSLEKRRLDLQSPLVLLASFREEAFCLFISLVPGSSRDDVALIA
jgi:hypothetical protein